jgi:phage repressor protein C with HTH and peptisase S24 domain
MPNLNEILDKIKDILSADIGDRKVFDKDVASALNINQISLATMKSRNKIPYKEILEFCAKKKISINWLVFDQIVDSLQSETQKFAKVSYFKDIYASAGGGALNYDEANEQLAIDEEILSHIGGEGKLKDIQAINVIGDSMEPTLNDGDIVFVDRSSVNPNKAGVYIVSTPFGLFIKRLQLQANGTVALVSDNDNYSDELVDSQDVEVLGKVIGSVTNNI